MTGPADSRPEPVVFHTAANPVEGRIVAGILQEAGIPTYVQGELLSDEFAVSRRLMNLQGVTLHVPSDRLAEAQRVLAEAKEAGKLLAGDDVDVADDDDAPQA